jgi:beta-phosphoglucomutase-like phosphatase (HAD superfamily)
MCTAGLTLAVASSSKREILQALIERAGVDDLLNIKTSADDAEHSKPDPDIVLAARSRLGMEPEKILMLGDTPYDVRSAAGAGVGLLAFRCGGFSDSDLRGALETYDDPTDLLRNFNRSRLSGG